MTVFEFNELVDGHLYRSESDHRVRAWQSANLMNCWSKKKITVDKLCGPPRFTAEEKQSGITPDFVVQPGDPGWDEFLSGFPEHLQKRITLKSSKKKTKESEASEV